ncbi:hypothetical protein [Flavobacterium rivuli]|nr:hypothetical protein [Flavobacterium rivuli]
MDLKLLSMAIGHLSCVVLCIGIILGMLFYKRLSGLHKCLTCYLALMLAVEVASVAVMMYCSSNLIILPIFSFLEMLFFVYLYNRYLLPRPDKLLLGLGLAGAIFIIAEFLQNFVFATVAIKDFQPYAKVVDNFIIVIMALFFFYQRANSFCETMFTNFRLNAVILIFFTINAIMFLPFNFFINDNTGTQFYVWTINVAVIALFYTYLVSLIYTCGIKNKCHIA